jgi:hypothetical protein
MFVNLTHNHTAVSGSSLIFFMLLICDKVTGESKISGDFPVIFKMELISLNISGIFPVMLREIPHFYVF